MNPIHNWSYIKSNPGWYSLQGTKEIFLHSKDGVVYVFYPENQFYARADSSCWSDSKFEEAIL